MGSSKQTQQGLLAVGGSFACAGLCCNCCAIFLTFTWAMGTWSLMGFESTYDFGLGAYKPCVASLACAPETKYDDAQKHYKSLSGGKAFEPFNKCKDAGGATFLMGIVGLLGGIMCMCLVTVRIAGMGSNIMKYANAATSCCGFLFIMIAALAHGPCLKSLKDLPNGGINTFLQWPQKLEFKAGAGVAFSIISAVLYFISMTCLVAADDEEIKSPKAQQQQQPTTVIVQQPQGMIQQQPVGVQMAPQVIQAQPVQFQGQPMQAQPVMAQPVVYANA